jgi:hypothetical protein
MAATLNPKAPEFLPSSLTSTGSWAVLCEGEDPATEVSAQESGLGAGDGTVLSCRLAPAAQQRGMRRQQPVNKLPQAVCVLLLGPRAAAHRLSKHAARTQQTVRAC